MIDRSLFALLLLTVLYIFLVKPHAESVSLLNSQIAVLDAQITAQENLKKFKADTEKRVKNIINSSAANEVYFYPAAQSNSVSLVELQDFVKNATKSSNMEFVSSNWGEPFSDQKTGITKLPLSFVVKGSPLDANTFLKNILFAQKLVKIERASITKYQNQQLLLNFSIVAFKPDRGKQ
jgi:hypothetical protein